MGRKRELPGVARRIGDDSLVSKCDGITNKSSADLMNALLAT